MKILIETYVEHKLIGRPTVGTTSHLPSLEVEATKAYRALCGFLEEKGITVPKSYVTWLTNITTSVLMTESPFYWPMCIESEALILCISQDAIINRADPLSRDEKDTCFAKGEGKWHGIQAILRPFYTCKGRRLRQIWCGATCQHDLPQSFFSSYKIGSDGYETTHIHERSW